MHKLKTITFACFGLTIVMLAVVSLLDVITGQEGTSLAIYKSTPFTLLWGVLTLSALIYICRRKLWKAPATMLIHVALGIILCGALVTHIWGRQGRLHVREEAPANFYIQEEKDAITRLPFTVYLESFEIRYYPGTGEPMDYISTLRLVSDQQEQTVTVSMNNIASFQHYRFCQSSYDSDLHGSILLLSHDPVGIAITYTGYGLLLLGMLLFWFQPQSQFHHIKRSRWINVLIGVLCILPLCIDFRPMMTYIRPVLRSPFFPIHVIAISFSYALLIYIMINGIVALLSKNEQKILRLKELSQLMLYPALFLLIAGIFLGAIWANVSWGRYWGWDSKEVWALITMMIYSLPLHQQSIRWFALPKHFHSYCVFAFLTVLMTYFGVNYFLVGLHSYV